MTKKEEELINWKLLSNDFNNWLTCAPPYQVNEFEYYANDVLKQFNGICGIKMGDTLSSKDLLFTWSLWLDDE